MPEKISELTTDSAINLALDTISKKKQALIFVNTKRSAEKLAEETGAAGYITKPFSTSELLDVVKCRLRR